MKNKVYIAGVPDELLLPNEALIERDDAIIHRIVTFVKPTIKDDDYEIVKSFPAREGFTRHSCLLEFKSFDKKKDLLKDCKNLKDLPEDHVLKKVYIKNEQTPLTRKENSRLYQEFKKLQEAHQINADNRVRLEKGKLYLNNTVVDEFNLANQIFQNWFQIVF